MLEIFTIGGYGEVGRNMTAVHVDGEVVIFDMGLHLPNYIGYTEDQEAFVKLTEAELKKVDAVPQDKVIKELKDKVLAIVPTHAHLDHIGAIPYMASKYKCPIYGTPFTIEVIKSILRDERLKIANDLRVMKADTTVQLSKNLKLEFVNVTHSIPQAVIIALHTPYGVVIYSNDFKFDNTPTLGKKPNYKALERLGNKGVSLAIIDSLYAHAEGHTPSESVAKEKLKDTLLNLKNEGVIVVTTFSSHIARIQSIIEYGKKMGREILILGRSMKKYSQASENANLTYFSKDAEIHSTPRAIAQALKKVSRNKKRYLLIATGHQGEPRAVLSRITNNVFNFKFGPGDVVIFSCIVIPSEINVKQRAVLEENISSYGVEIFRKIHESGHASQEDHKKFIELLKPKVIIPAHAEEGKEQKLLNLAKKMGYKQGKTMFLMNNGDHLALK